MSQAFGLPLLAQVIFPPSSVTLQQVSLTI